MDKKILVCGNWKMNGDKDVAEEIIRNLRKSQLDPNVEVVVGVTSIYLAYVRSIVPDNIQVAAQNSWKEANGDFTGEISPAMIKDNNVDWVILGHSERRTLFAETDELIADKVALAIEAGLKVIVCFGETLEERDADSTKEVVFRQVQALIPAIGTNWDKVVLAYEPVWAIDTGRTALPHQAQDVNATLRNWISSHVSLDVARTLRILYGGLVTAANAKELASFADIDGFLVGDASLGSEFIDIINANH